MQKVFRTFLVILLLAFFSLGCYLLYTFFLNKDILLHINEDPSILIPIILTLLAIPSFFFNLEKLLPDSFVNIYKVIRALDFIFSISLFFISLIGFYLFFNDSSVNNNNNTLVFFKIIIFLSSLLIFSICLFFDNFKFHRNKKPFTSEDIIDDIGK